MVLNSSSVIGIWGITDGITLDGGGPGIQDMFADEGRIHGDSPFPLPP